MDQGLDQDVSASPNAVSKGRKMQFYTVNATIDTLPDPVRRHFMTFEGALLMASDLVNVIRRAVDDTALPPVPPERWQEGLREVQRTRLARQDMDPAALDDRMLAEASGWAVNIEDMVLEDVQLPSLLNEQEAATILAALDLLGENGCPDHLVEVATSQYRYELMDSDRIEELRDRFLAGGTPHEKPQVILSLEGGRVTGVLSDRPVVVHVLDHDVGDGNDARVRDIPEECGPPLRAIPTIWRDEDLLVDPDRVSMITSALARDGVPSGAA